jgi:hypothetical protein
MSAPWINKKNAELHIKMSYPLSAKYFNDFISLKKDAGCVAIVLKDKLEMHV